MTSGTSDFPVNRRDSEGGLVEESAVAGHGRLLIVRQPNGWIRKILIDEPADIPEDSASYADERQQNFELLNELRL